MEKVSAACAMEWSVELEKALRSKAPGRAVEAISQVGRRLEQWSREPEPTMAVYHLYGLLPGEDRLFANAILLRLAGAFMSGERDVKLAVVRAFMGLRKSHKKRRSKSKNGILSKSRVTNYPELLRRVKAVFDSGDAESRAMALLLFGCWADFAKDNAHIRYLILSSVVSSDVLEVKASLFAAGCFCELSSDFAVVVLEMLVNLVTSSDIPLTVRWSGVRTFSRMECSYLIADRAYKTGLKLLLESAEEDFQVEMLISLSKLAGTSLLHASEQVQMLFSFVDEGKTLKMQETSLRCLHYMVKRGGSCLFDGICARQLFKIVNGSEVPITLQCKALRILHQILLYSLPNTYEMEMLDFDKLFNCFKSAPFLIELKSQLAMRVLANLCTKISVSTEMGSSGFFPTMRQDFVSSLMERINFLVKPLLDPSEVSSAAFFNEVRTELTFLLHLVSKQVDLGVVLLDNFHLIIRHIVDEYENLMPSLKEVPWKAKGLTIGPKLLSMFYRFLVAFLATLDEMDGITAQIFENLKVLVRCICDCKLFPSYIPTVFSLLLCSRMIWSGVMKENKEINENFSYEYWLESETCTLMCAQKMLNERDYWFAYNAGIQTACHGAWCTSTSIFGNLLMQVQSDSCYFWLKSLAQLSICEMKIQLLLLPNQGSRSLKCLELVKLPVTLFRDEIAEIGKYIAEHDDAHNNTRKLFGICSSLSSSYQTLKSCISSAPTFNFQTWFLNLRSKLVENVLQTINSSAAVTSNRDSGSFRVTEQRIVGAESLQKSNQLSMAECLHKYTQLSARFKQLSEEFDLIASCSIGIDRKSLKVITILALGCSLLSFAAGFAFFVPHIPSRETWESVSQDSEEFGPAMLLENLVARVGHMDYETSASLYELAEATGWSNSCFHLQSRNGGSGIDCEMRNVLSLCRSAVAEVLHLHHQAKGMDKEKILLQVTEHGQNILLNATMGWMRIPFGMPRYFFKTRPCTGSEIFVVNVDNKQSDGIFVSSTFWMSLNLCIQMRNIPLNLLIKPIKLHCIFCCSVSFQETVPRATHNKSAWDHSHSQKTDDMLRLNEKLYHHVTNPAKKNDHKLVFDSNVGKAVEAFVSFEVNERGQGFSSCLLDVSGFPVGTYRMKWHSCCVDTQGSYWSLIPLNEGPVFTVR